MNSKIKSAEESPLVVLPHNPTYDAVVVTGPKEDEVSRCSDLTNWLPSPVGRNSSKQQGLLVDAFNRASRGSIGSVATSKASSLGLRPYRLFGVAVVPNFWPLIFAAGFCVIASLTVTVSNRLLFGYCKFPALVAQPFQIVGSIVISAAFGAIAAFVQSDVPVHQRVWPPFRIEWSWVKFLFPLALIYIPRIFFTNQSISVTPISTYQILRSSAVGFSTVFTWLILGKPPTIPVASSCLIILGGVGVARLDGTVLSNEAVVWWILAASATSLYLVLLKYYLQVASNNVPQILNYNLFITFWILLIIVPFTPDFQRSKRFFWWSTHYAPHDMTVRRAWVFMALSVVSSFLINIAQMRLVKEASAVTADVIGTFKGSLQVIVGIVCLKESYSVYNVSGAVMSIIGSLCFAKAKHLEHQQQLENAVKKVNLPADEAKVFKDPQR